MRPRDVPYTTFRTSGTFRRVILSLVSLVSLGPALTACKGCGDGASEQPIRFVAKDAEAALEIRDLGMLAKSRNDLVAAVSPAITADQISALEQELALSLGFNPATEKGLEEAGLPKQGPIAIQMAAGGQGALWIIPVKDSARFEKVLDKVARARATVESVEKVKLANKDATIMSGTFGPEKFVVAVYAFDRGLAFVGAGRSAKELVEKALAIDGKDANANITSHPEYAALRDALGDKWDLRLIVPAAGATASGALQTLSQLGGAQVARALAAVPEVRGLKSAGWTLSFEKRAAEVNGRIRVDDAQVAKMKAMFANVAAAPAGVRAAAVDDAVVYAYAAANPLAAMAELAPEGSEARAALDRSFGRVKQDIDTDVEKEIVPLLSGHVALAVGLRNLAGLDLKRLVEDPRVLWVLLAFGTPDAEKLLAIEKRMDPGLEQRGYKVDTRASEGNAVHVIAKTPLSEGGKDILVESVAAGGARIFSTEMEVTDRATKSVAAPKVDPLGKPGLFVELRFGVLSKQLAVLDLASLPVLYRAVAVKVLEALRLLDRAVLHVVPADDGIGVKARIELAAAQSAQSK